MPQHTTEHTHTHLHITPSIFSKAQFDEWLILLDEQRAVGGNDSSPSFFFLTFSLSFFLSVYLLVSFVVSESR